MQEKFKINLPDSFKMPADDAQVLATIEVLFAPGNSAYQLLLEALTEENKDKFGSSLFSGLQFEVKRFDPVDLNGRVRVNYKLQITFSCSAIVNDLNNQHSYWNFEIERHSNIAFFEGDEYGDLRSTSNEF